MIKVKRYKPNVVYVAKLRGIYFYVGCLCVKRKWLTDSLILHGSGNPLHIAHIRKYITKQEYLENIELLHIEEFDSKDEALKREVELIKEYKEFYPNLLANKCLFGNSFGTKGIKLRDETRQKMSNARKGITLSLETRQKISKAQENRKPCSEETRRKLSFASKRVWDSYSEEEKINRINLSRDSRNRNKMNEANFSVC